jgi:hypothetical protein
MRRIDPLSHLLCGRNTVFPQTPQTCWNPHTGDALLLAIPEHAFLVCASWDVPALAKRNGFGFAFPNGLGSLFFQCDLCIRHDHTLDAAASPARTSAA